MKKLNKLLYIITFILLYCGVALVSTLHAVQFFELSNVFWIAIILAVCFELGQAVTLFSILTTPSERKKVLPWVLMSILTIVQIIGNVYACYKYILLNSIDNLKYFKEPIFIWTQLPDEQSTVILTYIAASILPIVALALTAMITSYLGDESSLKTNSEENEKPKSQEIQESLKEILSERQPDTSNEGILRNDPEETVQVLEDDQEDNQEEKKMMKKTHLIR